MRCCLQSYLLRLSDPGFFSVSYTCKDPDTGALLVQHFRVEKAPGGYAVETVDVSAVARRVWPSSLSTVVCHHQEEVITYASLEEVIASHSHVLLEPVSHIPFSEPKGDFLLTSNSSTDDLEVGGAASTKQAPLSKCIVCVCVCSRLVCSTY